MAKPTMTNQPASSPFMPVKPQLMPQDVVTPEDLGLYQNLNMNKNPVNALLQQAAHETPDMLAHEYNRLRGLIGGSGININAGDSVLDKKIQNLTNQRVGDINADFNRNIPVDYASRMQNYQGLANSAVAEEQAKNIAEQEKWAQQEAKRAQFISGMLGIAGGVVGGVFGGPAGAAAGAGVGTAVGGAIV